MTITRIDLLRHGVCDDGQIYRGRTDSALSASGYRQMQAAVEGQEWQVVIASPLQRCRCFAQDLADEQQIPLIINDDLIELNFGVWEGQALDAVWSAYQKDVMAFWNDPVQNPPLGGESLSSMQERVVSVLEYIHAKHRGKKVLLVTHGGVIRLLVGYLLQMPIRAVRQLSVDYGSMSRIEIYPEIDSEGFASEVIYTNRLTNVSFYDGHAADDLP